MYLLLFGLSLLPRKWVQMFANHVNVQGMTMVKGR